MHRSSCSNCSYVPFSTEFSTSMTVVALSCSCGKLTGKLDPKGGNRLVCYCGDCQMAARYLQPDRPQLDPNGGSDIFQVAPCNLQLTGGLEHLACVRLSPKGLLRWYAECCNSAFGLYL